ncbi:transaldolase [Deferribacter desulfuricans SSM1]|uniref:Probable transaldolase n=1 Tax=Deferribacter desulfuricans (strain DSM 14783 / JCM 11476 / NBRC 101012 / SSM1) TaxID=639282 RepID=D3PB80_DEFDS|nr:fructose-6-phosphate aldolase [Deferribacter desulfuricans]BAI79853.1 transaldolase [Deferribacter desulfuricans SSM1]
MKIFLDTANIDEIKEAVSYGIVDGVTTNPSLIAKEKRDFKETIKEICDIVKGPVSAEVIATDYEGMVKEAKELASISEYVVVKIPFTENGLKATYTLNQEGIDVNMTLIFSANQALLACKAGARYISPFAGRLDDVGHDGMDIVLDCQEVVLNYDFDTEVIAASIRHPLHVQIAALNGVDIATIPFKVLKQLFKHPLTDIGLEKFLADWKNANK